MNLTSTDTCCQIAFQGIYRGAKVQAQIQYDPKDPEILTVQILGMPVSPAIPFNLGDAFAGSEAATIIRFHWVEKQFEPPLDGAVVVKTIREGEPGIDASLAYKITGDKGLLRTLGARDLQPIVSLSYSVATNELYVDMGMNGDLLPDFVKITKEMDLASALRSLGLEVGSDVKWSIFRRRTYGGPGGRNNGFDELTPWYQNRFLTLCFLACVLAAAAVPVFMFKKSQVQPSNKNNQIDAHLAACIQRYENSSTKSLIGCYSTAVTQWESELDHTCFKAARELGAKAYAGVHSENVTWRNALNKEIDSRNRQLAAGPTRKITLYKLKLDAIRKRNAEIEELLQ